MTNNSPERAPEPLCQFRFGSGDASSYLCRAVAAIHGDGLGQINHPFVAPEPVAEEPRWQRLADLSSETHDWWEKRLLLGNTTYTYVIPVDLEAAIAEEARRAAEAFSTRTAERAEAGIKEVGG